MGIRKLIVEGVVAGCGFLLAATMGHCNQGCALFQSQEAMDAAYKAELAKCVTDSPTRESADACRKAVNAKYKVCEDPGNWPQYRPCPE